MKAILEFNLPEEQEEFDLACDASAYRSILWDVDQQVREWLKFGPPFAHPDAALEAIREMISDKTMQHGIPWY